jgi:hypothetical protein
MASRFQRAVARAFFGITPSVTAEVRAGPGGLRLGFTSKTLANFYLRSFVPGRPDRISLSLLVLTPDDLDLSHLIPVPSEQGRTLVNDAYAAVWHADRLPILYILDRRLSLGIVWLARGRAPGWELSRPACPLIHANLLEGPWTAAHGGAVGHDGRMLLLAGKGGSGKTTATLACAKAGWDYAGDDYILANTQSGQVEPLYISARLRIDLAPSFPGLLRELSHGITHDRNDSKHELGLGPLLGAERSRGGRLTAILLPRRRGARLPEFEPARRTDAFHALFLTTSLGVPSTLEMTSRKLMALVALAPAFFVDTGATPDAIPDAFAALIETL